MEIDYNDDNSDSGWLLLIKDYSFDSHFEPVPFINVIAIDISPVDNRIELKHELKRSPLREGLSVLVVHIVNYYAVYIFRGYSVIISVKKRKK